MAKWVEVAIETEFAESDRKMVDLGGREQIGLFKVVDKYWAISAWCTHMHASMVHGPLDGHELMCPLHGARFDIRNGAALSFPATTNVKTYKTKVEDGKILIKV